MRKRGGAKGARERTNRGPDADRTGHAFHVPDVVHDFVLSLTGHFVSGEDYFNTLCVCGRVRVCACVRGCMQACIHVRVLVVERRSLYGLQLYTQETRATQI